MIPEILIKISEHRKELARKFMGKSLVLKRADQPLIYKKPIEIHTYHPQDAVYFWMDDGSDITGKWIVIGEEFKSGGCTYVPCARIKCYGITNVPELESANLNHYYLEPYKETNNA